MDPRGSEATTWNDIGTPGADADYAQGVVALIPDLLLGQSTLDVTASASRWSADASINFGWFFEASRGNGVSFSSREAVENPRLGVTYLAP